MKILPAIDVIGGQAVRLLKGDYAKMTVYDASAVNTAKKFNALGAKNLHVVDLDGAKSGNADNLKVITEIIKSTDMLVEIGGGIRSDEIAEKYIEAGAGRIIIGTAAVTDRPFLRRLIKNYGDKVAVGADLKDGKVAIKGWLESSALTAEQFFMEMQDEGVKTVICTDVSRDGAMRGTNLDLYASLNGKFNLDVIASGGVSSISDVEALKNMGVYGAIIGKAYYEGAIDLEEAIRIANDN